MKVVCINDKGWAVNKGYLWGLFIRKNIPADGPSKGDICTVIEEFRGYYSLEEWGDDDVFAKSQFVHLRENISAEVTFEKIIEEVPVLSN